MNCVSENLNMVCNDQVNLLINDNYKGYYNISVQA